MKHTFKFLALALLAPLAALHAKDEPRPNIVFIIADDLGIGDLSCYGATRINTPNLDRLAAQGVRATDAHASASVCTPSRYAILTGRNYWRIEKNWEGEMLVEADRPTVAKTLREAGYATAYFGKWHLGWGVSELAKPRAHRSDWDWNAETLAPGVLETGYDTFFGSPFSANEPPLVFVENRTVFARDPADPLVIVDPKVEKYFGFGTSKGAKAAHEARPLDQIDSIVTSKVVRYIEEHKDKPFYLHLALVAPHVPIAPSKEFQGRSTAGRYGDFVEEMDACVGRVMAALDQAGLSENTLLIFTSDNGAILDEAVHKTGHRSNKELLGQKTDAWEGGVNVPFLAQWPGKIPAGSTCKQLISLNDFYASACAAAGVAIPPRGAPDSLNILPVLLDPKAVSVRTEMTYNAISKPHVALRSGPWVYLPAQGSFGVTTNPDMAWAMQFEELGLSNSDYTADGLLKPEAPKVQLYNLENDPRQSTNLAASNPEKVKELAARLTAIMSEKSKNEK
jgi:arylsulfatase A-like enzyme